MITTHRKPLQFGLATLFWLILAIALPLAALRSGGLFAAIVWLPVEMLFGVLAVEAAACIMPKFIELRIQLGVWGRKVLETRLSATRS
jgi:hypothetical protein